MQKESFKKHEKQYIKFRCTASSSFMRCEWIATTRRNYRPAGGYSYICRLVGLTCTIVEASAAIQRLLVSFWRYLANENYDLSSEGFYGTSASVSSCCTLTYVWYVYQTVRANRIGPSRTFFPSSGMHVMITLPIFVDISQRKR